MFRSLRHRLTTPSDGLLLCVLVSLSLCLFVASESAWYDDATTYTADILAGRLIEPGHLLWRPSGHLLERVTGAVTYSAVLWRLQFLCLLASVLAVIAMYLLALRMYGRLGALAAATLMAVSNGFWSYAFSGGSYSLSMLFAILALRCAISSPGIATTGTAAFVAGALGGLSVATWGIQILAAPALWIALILTPPRDQTSIRQHLRNTAALTGGYLLTFVVPLLAAFLIQTRAHGVAVAGTPPQTLSLASWLASSRHGIPAHYGVAQLLRVLIGWPQSVISTSDLGSRLRLWGLHETAFPASAWLGALVIFYGTLTGAIFALARGFTRLESRDRGVIVACAAALGINLLFAAAWQGTDLERYFPSLPYQLLLVALLVKLLVTIHPVRRIAAAVAATLAGLVVVNWYGTFHPVLAADSYRQIWLRELRRATSARDRVILFGQRTQLIVSPHDPDLPKIDNVSLEIAQRGEGWRAAELRNIAETRHHGGRVFLADTLFGTDSAPRDGWSFREYPRPTPSELREVFLPFKSERVGFVVGTEKVWLGSD
jgi:hypothetical protein